MLGITLLEDIDACVMLPYYDLTPLVRCSMRSVAEAPMQRDANRACTMVHGDRIAGNYVGLRVKRRREGIGDLDPIHPDIRIRCEKPLLDIKPYLKTTNCGTSLDIGSVDPARDATALHLPLRTCAGREGRAAVKSPTLLARRRRLTLPP